RLKNFSGHKTYGKGRGLEGWRKKTEDRRQETGGRRQETEDRRQERVGERKGSRIRGFKGSSGSLGIFFSKPISEGVEWKKIEVRRRSQKAGGLEG
ncbi:MAG TPA: hypothetical protein PLA06_03510, partial [Syntrophorhabdaceae bacterium]|nr:hypothetical protein [Syntrophorhabdaceae bacterium]